MQQNQKTIFFTTTSILINFLHNICMDFTYEIIGEQMLDVANHGLDDDF